MGCDIHLYVEVKKDGKWQSADKWTHDKYAEDPNALTVDYDNLFYSGRNYNLFAMLAGVRNNCDIIPVVAPRGLPNDACESVRKLSDDFGEDGHSHSWMTVRELMDYDWTQTTIESGWVDASNYYQWCGWGKKHGECPKSFCGGVSGQSVEHISVEEMDRRIDALKQPFIERNESGWYQAVWKLVEEQMPNAYCNASWEMPYYKMARGFLSDCLPQLWKLGDSKNVRIVFWFDN